MAVASTTGEGSLLLGCSSAKVAAVSRVADYTASCFDFSLVMGATNIPEEGVLCSEAGNSNPFILACTFLLPLFLI